MEAIGTMDGEFFAKVRESRQSFFASIQFIPVEIMSRTFWGKDFAVLLCTLFGMCNAYTSTPTVGLNHFTSLVLSLGEGAHTSLRCRVSAAHKFMFTSRPPMSVRGKEAGTFPKKERFWRDVAGPTRLHAVSLDAAYAPRLTGVGQGGRRPSTRLLAS